MAGLIDKGEIFREALQKAAEKIKPQVAEAIAMAVDDFYGSASPGNYARVMGFQQYASVQPSEAYSDTSLTLTYTFTAPDVNSWQSPWGISYSGDPEQALNKAYDEGLHGGPKPVESYVTGFWTWDRTQQTTPLGDLIIQQIGTISL